MGGGPEAFNLSRRTECIEFQQKLTTKLDTGNRSADQRQRNSTYHSGLVTEKDCEIDRSGERTEEGDIRTHCAGQRHSSTILVPKDIELHKTHKIDDASDRNLSLNDCSQVKLSRFWLSGASSSINARLTPINLDR